MLSTPPAFVLSQDQTLQKEILNWRQPRSLSAWTLRSFASAHEVFASAPECVFQEHLLQESTAGLAVHLGLAIQLSKSKPRRAYVTASLLATASVLPKPVSFFGNNPRTSSLVRCLDQGKRELPRINRSVNNNLKGDNDFFSSSRAFATGGVRKAILRSGTSFPESTTLIEEIHWGYEKNLPRTAFRTLPLPGRSQKEWGKSAHRRLSTLEKNLGKVTGAGTGACRPALFAGVPLGGCCGVPASPRECAR